MENSRDVPSGYATSREHAVVVVGAARIAALHNADRTPAQYEAPKLVASGIAARIVQLGSKPIGEAHFDPPCGVCRKRCPVGTFAGAV